MQDQIKRPSFIENISAKFSKTFAEKIPEEIQQNVKQKASEAAPYILSGVIGGLVSYALIRRGMPLRSRVSSITINHNYYK